MRKIMQTVSILLIPLIFLLFSGVFCISAGAVMPDHEQVAIARMKAGFYAFEESIDLLGLGVTPDNVGRLFIFALKNDPYLFFVDTKLSYYYKKDSDSFIIRPRYTVSRDEAYDMIAFCIEEVAKIAERARHPLLTDAERALLIHDIICEEYSYDATYQNDNVYKFLAEGTGTCQGYMWAYMAVMRELSIECCYVASDTINHIWNMVKIDGEWYHVDLTWDDAGSEVSRRHFLCSDKTARARGHKDWYSTEETVCASEKYSVCNLDALLHSDFESGDVDHSGCVDLGDALSVRGYLSDDTFSGFCLFCADADGNGIVDGADVEFLRKKLLQLD